MSKPLKISQHKDKYIKFLEAIITIQESTSFSPTIEKLLETSVIDEYLVFSVTLLVENNYHNLFIELLIKLKNLASQPRDFALLKKQCKLVLKNICGFNTAFQNSIHHDIISYNRDEYLSKDQTGWINGVDNFAAQSIDDKAIFDLLEKLISFMSSTFPDFLERDTASSICGLLIQLKCPVLTDLKYISKITPNDDFLKLLMTEYFDEISRDYLLEVINILFDSTIPKMNSDLLNLLKPLTFSHLLSESKLKDEHKQKLFDMATKNTLDEFVNDLHYQKEPLQMSRGPFERIIPLLIAKDIRPIVAFFDKAIVQDMTREQVFDFVVQKWLNDRNLYLGLLKILSKIDHGSQDYNYSNEIRIYVELLKKTLAFLGLSPKDNSPYLWWAEILDKTLEIDSSVLEWLMVDENIQLFCLLSEKTVISLSEQLLFPNLDVKSAFNLITRFFVWAYSPNNLGQRQLKLSFPNFCSEFVNLLSSKKDYNFEKSHIKYNYQQKVLKLLAQHNLQLSDVGVIEKYIGSVQRPVLVDNDQLLLPSRCDIVWNKESRMILSTRYGCKMIDNQGYLIWQIGYRSKDSIVRVFDNLMFVKGDHQFVFYDLNTGEFLKEQNKIGSTSVNKICNFRQPLSENDDIWYFITSELELYRFDKSALEFTFWKKDENFPKNASGDFFTFVGSNIYYGSRMFFTKVSLYSTTQQKIVNDILDKTKIDEIFPYNNAICYIDKDVLHIIQNETQSTHDISGISDSWQRWHIFKNIKQLDNTFCLAFNMIEKTKKTVLYFPNEKDVVSLDLSDILTNTNYLGDVEIFPTTNGVVFYDDRKLHFKTQNMQSFVVDVSKKILEKSNDIKYLGYKVNYHLFFENHNY